MVYGVPFEAKHLSQMAVQEAQAWIFEHVDFADIAKLESPWATTIMQDGQPVFCGGAVPLWDGRAYVWSYFSDRVNRRNFVAVTNFVRGLLDGMPFERLEASVECGFEAGHRWMKALGFDLEAPRMRAFQHGRDCAGYARVRI